MSQLSFSSFDDVVLVRDAQGRYLPASVDQILEEARLAIKQKTPADRVSGDVPWHHRQCVGVSTRGGRGGAAVQ